MSILSISALWITGNKWRHAWKIVFLNELIWLTWIILAAQWGFLPLNIFTLAVAIRNNLLWNKK
jgi:hypothetical protein